MDVQKIQIDSILHCTSFQCVAEIRAAGKFELHVKKVARPKSGRPLRNRAEIRDFVEDSSPHGFRDEEGDLGFELHIRPDYFSEREWRLQPLVLSSTGQQIAQRQAQALD
jgi:hypothetical protein